MKYFYTFAFLFLLSHAIFCQQSTIDSLTQKINNYDLKDTIKAEMYQDLIWEYFWIDPNVSVKLSNELIEISEEINYIIGKANGNSNKGLAFFYLTDYDSSLYYHQVALRIRKEVKDQIGIAVSYNNIGITYTAQNKFEEALEVWLKSIKIKEQLLEKDASEERQNSLASAYGNIGSLFSDMERYEKSKYYTEKSLEIFKKTNNERGIAMGYGNLANAYKNIGDNTGAFVYYEMAIKLSKELGSKFDLALHLFNYGETLSEAAKYKLSEKKINEALTIQREIDDFEGIALSYLILSGIKKEQNNKSQSLQHGKEALQIALEYKLVRYYDPIYENLVDIYKSFGMIDEAFQTFEQKIILKDSLANIANESQLVELEAIYQNEQNLKEIESNEKELTIANFKQQKQQYFLRGTIVLACLIIGFTIVVYNRLKITRKQKLLIEQKNKENELLLGEIHHRVKNNLQVISSLLSLQERNITDETAKAAILDGKERVQSMGLIHKMLYQQNNFSGINMSEYIEKLISGLLDSFGKNSDEFELNYDINDISLDVDTAIPLGLIINELVVNALKHAYTITSKPTMNVSLQEVDSQLVLKIQDNGVGEVADVQASQSFGMKLVKSLSRQLSGTINMEQQNGLSFKIAVTDYKLI